MEALTILIIRHAEKPEEQHPEPGLTDQGQQDTESLIVRGWQRAGAWAALFGAGFGGADYPRPQAIYAAKPGPTGSLNQGPSRRPAETIHALAPRLGIKPDETIAKGEEERLVKTLLGLSGVVLVSWEHKAIYKEIIPRIPVSHGAPPTDWPGDRYDVVLRFDRPKGSDKFSYRPLYPQLLSGDSNQPLDPTPRPAHD